MNFTNEQISKARQAKSSEELLTLAKENGVELSAEQAKAYFSELHKESELSENELDTVAGGNKEPKEPKALKPSEYYYPDFDGAETYFTWKPICPNDLGLRMCDDCEGIIGHNRCSGHHKRRES